MQLSMYGFFNFSCIDFFWTKWIFQPLQSKFCQDLNYDLGARAYAQSQISPLL